MRFRFPLNHSLCILSVYIVCISPVLSQETEKKSDDAIWQPKQAFPPLVIAKIDASDETRLSVLIPETIYQQMIINYPSKKTEGQTNTIGDLREYFGPLERKSIPLNDLRFETIDGKQIPVDQAVHRLSTAQHVFYGRGPDKYHAQVVHPETIVLKSSTEASLPRSKATFPPEQ